MTYVPQPRASTLTTYEKSNRWKARLYQAVAHRNISFAAAAADACMSTTVEMRDV